MKTYRNLVSAVDAAQQSMGRPPLPVAVNAWPKFLLRMLAHEGLDDEITEADKDGLCAIAQGIFDALGGGVPKALLEAAAIQRRKNADYNDGVYLGDYFPFGLRSYTQELHKKTLRLVSLCRSGKEPANESVRDTALDIINYASFLVKAIDEGEL